MSYTTRMQPKAVTEPPAGLAKDTAYEHAKLQILEGRVPDSRFLTEEGVAKELGISRTPVREAFLRLEAEGLLELFPRRGAYVGPISRQDVSDVMEVRVAIEVFCVEKLLVDRLPVTAALEELLAEQRGLATQGPLERFIDCDRRFHCVLVSATRNRMLRDLYESLRDRQLRMGVKAVLDEPDRVEHVLREHERMVEAIARADVAEARDATLSHLYATLAVLQRERETP